ncbi:RNA polymerase sigma factor RpoD/SigA [uncultured Vibrio sp.]|uniref:sigma-70 family RNA polymerase sigma factor n=1 Tax=uncultured Vibrio sp. TaxID=114054 RepID=UPI0026114D80|nr:sigma-70 family RNA polymerase sigma factor [uncultured Vibrio sp.]
MMSDRLTTSNNTGVVPLISLYISDISRHSLLTREEEYNTCKLVQGGDVKARDKLIESNLRLVVKCAKQFSRNNIGTLNLLDLIEEGNIGLMKAANRFNPDLGHKFSTYAIFWIKDSIQTAIMNQKENVRVPIYKQKESISLKKQEDRELQNELRKDPQKSTIEFTVGVMHQPSVELDDLPSENLMQQPQHQFMNSEFSDYFYSLVESLPDKEKSVLINRFGLKDNPAKTLKELGSELEISPETVRNVQNSAIDKIKRELNKLGLIAH